MKQVNPQRVKILFIVSIICLVVGAVLFFISSGSSNVNESLLNGGSLEGKSAAEIAEIYSNNNRGNLMSNSLANFLLGFGLVTFLFSGYMLLKNAKK